MTPQALADGIGVTRQTVFAIEKGKYSPSLKVAFRIAETFSVTLDEVFQFKSGKWTLGFVGELTCRGCLISAHLSFLSQLLDQNFMLCHFKSVRKSAC